MAAIAAAAVVVAFRVFLKHGQVHIRDVESASACVGARVHIKTHTRAHAEWTGVVDGR